MKVCSACTEEKPDDRFDAQRRQCKDCRAEKTRERRARNWPKYHTRSKEWRAENPDKVALYELTKKVKMYGLTVEEYQSLLDKQDSRCAGCGVTHDTIDPRTGRPRALAIDHCHDNDTVRGLLCSGCNVALGMVRNSPDTLRTLAEYLEQCHHSK